jgi:hypothetical protein
MVTKAFSWVAPALVEMVQRELGTVKDAERAARLLRVLTADMHGEEESYRIFAKLGKKPGRRDAAHFKNLLLLERYNRMKPPNVQQLAKRLAEENKDLPPEEQRGAGGTDPFDLERHIRDLLKKRTENPGKYPSLLGDD